MRVAESTDGSTWTNAWSDYASVNETWEELYIDWTFSAGAVGTSITIQKDAGNIGENIYVDEVRIREIGGDSAFQTYATIE